MSPKRTGLTRESIIDAAKVLADGEGLESLSMRKLAGALGVQAMSLYNHVDGRDDLLDGLVEAVVSEFDVPAVGGDWKDGMRRRARSVHQVLLRHPWAITLLLTRENAGPNMLRFVDATLGCLVSAGFPYSLADHAWNAMDNHIYGYTLQEVNFPFEEDRYAEAAEEYRSVLEAGDYPHLAAITGQIIRGEYSGIHDFDFGLDIILDGLERIASA